MDLYRARRLLQVFLLLAFCQFLASAREQGRSRAPARRRVEDFTVLRFSTWLNDTPLQGVPVEADPFLLFPALPAAKSDGPIAKSYPHFFSRDNAFPRSRPKIFRWPSGRGELIRVTRRSDDSVALELPIPWRLYSMTAAEGTAMLSEFHHWLLTEGRPIWPFRSLYGGGDRSQFDDSMENSLAAFFQVCVTDPEKAAGVQCSATNLKQALSATEYAREAAENDASQPMHLIWITKGMTLQISWAQEFQSFRSRGSVFPLLIDAAPTAGAPYRIKVETLIPRRDPFEPFQNLTTSEASLPNPPALFSGIGDAEKQRVRVPSGQAVSIFAPKDIMDFGSRVAAVPASASQNLGMILARPPRFQRYSDDDRIPPDWARTVSSMEQLYVLSIFASEAVAAEQFNNRSTPVWKTGSVGGPNYADVAAIFENGAEVEVFWDLYDGAGGPPRLIRAGTSLASTTESKRPLNALGQPVTIMRPRFCPAPAPRVKEGFYNRVTMRDLPPESVLASVPHCHGDTMYVGIAPENSLASHSPARP
jgi:hypothetical protein